MPALIATAVFGVVLVAAILFFQFDRRRRSKERFASLELRPNCLLTRHPIAFLSSARSIFRPFEHWNDVPQYLREHGYEVMVLEPTPGQDATKSVLKALAELTGRCHVIADSSLRTELEAIANARLSAVVSLTCIVSRDRAQRLERIKASDFKPPSTAIETFEVGGSQQSRSLRDIVALILLGVHNLILFGQSRPPVDPIETAESAKSEACFLDLAVALAERDIRWSQ